MSLNKGFFLRQAASSRCQRTQDVFFLKDETFNCIYEDSSGAACTLPSELDPTQVANNFQLRKTRATITDPIIPKVKFVTKNPTTNLYVILAAEPVPTPVLASITKECTYPSLISKIDYIIHVTGSSVTDVLAVVEVAPFS